MRDPIDCAELAQPACQCREARRLVREGPLAEDLAEVIDGARRERLLVGVDSDHVHVGPSAPHTMGAGQAGKCALR